MMGDAVIFNPPSLQDEWNDRKLARDLKMVVFDAGCYLRCRYDEPFIVTCIYRPPEDPETVHTDYRGVDGRTFHLPDLAAEELVAYINSRYMYWNGLPYKVAGIHPNRGALGTHFHFQAPWAPRFIKAVHEIGENDGPT